VVGLAGGGWLGFGCCCGCGGFAVAVGLEWDWERDELCGCCTEHKTFGVPGDKKLPTGSRETVRSFR